MWPAVVALGVGTAVVVARVRLIKRSWRRLQVAVETGDAANAKRHLARLKRLHARHDQTLNLLHLTHAWLLTDEERYLDARFLLEHTDPNALPAERLPFYEGQLALCFAHTDEQDRAVELAHIAVWRAGNVNQPLLPYCKRIVGVALLRSGRSNEAIEALQDAAEALHPEGDAMRAFHLGEALRAVGRTDEAQQAYDRARRAAPGSRWSGRAEERLVALAERSPYR